MATRNPRVHRLKAEVGSCSSFSGERILQLCEVNNKVWTEICSRSAIEFESDKAKILSNGGFQAVCGILSLISSLVTSFKDPEADVGPVYVFVEAGSLLLSQLSSILEVDQAFIEGCWLTELLLEQSKKCSGGTARNLLEHSMGLLMGGLTTLALAVPRAIIHNDKALHTSVVA